MRTPRRPVRSAARRRPVRGVWLAAGLAGLLAACGPGASRNAQEAPEKAAGGTAEAAAAIGEPPAEPPAEGSAATEPAAAGTPAEAPEGTAEAPSFLSEKNRRDVTLYFQDPDSDLLVPEKRQIFLTNSLSDQAKQIVVELIDGPRGDDLLPTMPHGTRVLGLYLDKWGTAYVDLSHELVSEHLGGSAEELATVYSLANSLTVNLPDIKRVHILVDGEERETLKDHVDLQRDYGENLSMVRGHEE